MRATCFAKVVRSTPVFPLLMALLVNDAAMAADADGLTLPEGFSATVVQEGQGAGRHLAVAANGDIYLASRDGLLAMRDKDGDGKADETMKFGDVQGTEVRLQFPFEPATEADADAHPNPDRRR